MQVDVGATAQLIIAVGGAVAILGAAMRWLLSALDKRVRAQLQPIVAEMQPNHGGSMKDKISEIADAVKSTQSALADEHDETERRHETNVRALRRHDAEMSTIRKAVLAIMLRKGDGENPRLTELERRIMEQIQVHEDFAQDRRTGRWRDDPDDFPTV